MTAAFLCALKASLSHEKAFEIAAKGFANYMINYYELILSSTRKGSQERFDRFRQHYEKHAAESDYVKIVKSRPHILEVRFERCPFAEVMREYNLADLTHAFCLSDYAFTEELLPGVELHRTHEIAKGHNFCDHIWIFHNE